MVTWSSSPGRQGITENFSEQQIWRSERPVIGRFYYRPSSSVLVQVNGTSRHLQSPPGSFLARRQQAAVGRVSGAGQKKTLKTCPSSSSPSTSSDSTSLLPPRPRPNSLVSSTSSSSTQDHIKYLCCWNRGRLLKHTHYCQPLC